MVETHDPTVAGTAAVLVDADTLPRFLGSGGLDPVVEQVAATARIVVRRAYGRWFGLEMHEAQKRLARLGFEMFHTFAPLPTRRPSTMQLVVDALEIAGCADRPSWFVLVSADCDLAPLARRLQRLGSRVMLVGPRGVADRTARACCDRLLLFDQPAPESPPDRDPPRTARADERHPDARIESPGAGRRGPPSTAHGVAAERTPAPPATRANDRAAPATSEVHDLARRLLTRAGGTLDCLRLRMTLVQELPGFDETALGFEDFLAFVRADRGMALAMNDSGWVVRLTAAAGESGSAGRAAAAADDSLVPPQPPPNAGSPPAKAERREPHVCASGPRSARIQVGSPFHRAAPSRDVYAGLLRKVGWDFAAAEPVRAVVTALPEGGLPATRAEMVSTLRERLGGAFDDRAVRRALSALCKSGCLVREGDPADGGRWRAVPGLTADEALARIDEAMLARLRPMCESYKVAWDPETARSLRLADGPVDSLPELPCPVGPPP